MSDFYKFLLLITLILCGTLLLINNYESYGICLFFGVLLFEVLL